MPTTQPNPTPGPLTPPLAQFDPSHPYGGISQTQGGAALTAVNPQELASWQLGHLQNSGNPLVQNAAQNAFSFASARGSGLSGSQYADNATRAAMNEMTPIAQADAGQYAAVRDNNQQAINQQNLQRMSGDSSVMVAGIGAQASMHNSDNSLHESRYEFDKSNDLKQKYRAQDREWQVADNNTSARASARSQFMNSMYQTVFSDPSIWKDPQGSMGLMNKYSSNIDQLLQQQFPEYFSTDQNGNPSNNGYMPTGPQGQPGQPDPRTGLSPRP